MAHCAVLHTTGPAPEGEELRRWLIEQGEPFEADADDALVLRALPLRLSVDEDTGHVCADFDVTPALPLSRLVDLLFDLSVVCGADVHLAPRGTVTRAALWMQLADEQDRMRLRDALARADEHGKLDTVLRRLWAILGTLRPGCDLRWSAEHGAIVDLREVGSPGGLTVEEATVLQPDAELGDPVAVPVHGTVHILAYRWLSTAFPSLGT